MTSLQTIAVLLVFCSLSSGNSSWFRKHGQQIKIGRNKILKYSEAWGYLDVRQGAHMFWWLYANAGDASRPLVLWLQGGPGASGVGFGNFAEIGPLDYHLKSRNTTWLQKADLLFVDNPVGTGFSYVDGSSKYTRNIEQISQDLLIFAQKFFGTLHREYQTRPFYIYCESYGGKMTAHFAMVLHKAILARKVAANLQGIGIGDGWVSAIDYVETWGPYLYATSYLDEAGLVKTQNLAAKCKQLVESGQWAQAEDCWSEMESLIETLTDNVSWYNILKRSNSDPWSQTYNSTTKADKVTPTELLYRRHVYNHATLADLMNGPIKRKLKIIPSAVKWGGQSGQVFQSQAGDFMTPVIDAVDYLLRNTTVKVSVYSGQLDLICGTPGTLKWMEKLTWPEYQNFKTAERTAFHLPNDYQTAGFIKRHGSLSFYWIMRGGHMLAHDVPDAALVMVENEVTG